MDKTYTPIRMSYRKVALLMLFPTLIELAFSCGCNCLEPVIGNYSNKSLQIYNINNADATAEIVYSGNVLRRAYGIRVRIKRDLACSQQYSPGIISSASAVECFCDPENQLFPIDSVTSIKIITLNDFDESHPADSDVSSYFKVYQPFQFLTIDEYLTPERDEWGNTRLAVYEYDEMDEVLDFLLMIPPPDAGAYRFKIQMTVSDGRSWEAITDEITLI
jgi:hypothetical protein